MFKNIKVENEDIKTFFRKERVIYDADSIITMLASIINIFLRFSALLLLNKVKIPWKIPR